MREAQGAVTCLGSAVFAGALGERCGHDSDCGPALFCGVKSNICVASSEADTREAKKLAAAEAAARRVAAESETRAPAKLSNEVAAAVG